MKTTLTTMILVVTSLATGCGATSGAAASHVAGPETVQLAPGIELRIHETAGAGARMAAERLQAEYRSIYLNAQ